MEEPKKLYPNYDMNIWLRTCSEEIETPLQGKQTGKIPSWIRGTLLRNGPGCYKIGNCEYRHVFDGLAIIHRFAIKGGRATYQSRFIRSETYKKNTAAQRIVVTEFGTMAVPDPCRTIFDRISSMFKFTLDMTDNTVVSVYPFGDQIYAMSEVPLLYEIDRECLKTLGSKQLRDPLIVSHSAHPHIMPNGDVYNVGLKVNKTSLSYAIVKFTNTLNGDIFDTAKIVCSIKTRWRLNPAYMHSFGLTENYIVIVEQPLSISLTKMLRRCFFSKPIASTLVSYPEYQTEIVLIHRGTGIQTRYVTDTIYFMHIINCFELDGNLIIDLCSYKDGKILEAMFVDAIQGGIIIVERLRWSMAQKEIGKHWSRPSFFSLNTDLITKSMQSNPDYGQWCQSRPKRIEIPLEAPPLTRVEARLIVDVGIETPRINYETYNGRPYRYFYGIRSDVNAEHAGSIVKVDSQTGNMKMWFESNSYPSEPIFVPRPHAKEEDDGVILSVVLWGKNDHAVTLLVLNASDLKEIARVDFNTPSQTPRCFHGWYLPDTP